MCKPALIFIVLAVTNQTDLFNIFNEQQSNHNEIVSITSIKNDEIVQEKYIKGQQHSEMGRLPIEVATTKRPTVEMRTKPGVGVFHFYLTVSKSSNGYKF